MLANVETPIFILAFCYTAVIVIAGVFFVLLVCSTTGIINYFDYKQKMVATGYCKVYQDRGSKVLYESCMKNGGVYYENHK
jgi:hypothetical protein